MTHKQRMLAAIRGEAVDQLPWAPRLDLWYNANKLAGTLPQQCRGASLDDIVNDMDVGFHAVIPNFRDLRSRDDDIDRAIGIYNLKTMPYQTILNNVQRTVKIEGDRTRVCYETPRGSFETVTLFNDQMRQAGITLTHIEEYAFKTVDDYEPLGCLFENATTVPHCQGYSRFAEKIGQRGLAVGFVNLAASGMHFIMRELMPVERFFYEMHDHPLQLNRLAEQIDMYLSHAVEVAASTTAEVIFVGANYDSSVTYPAFFQNNIMPSLKKYANIIHGQDKYLLTHTDGENSGLLRHYLNAGIDIVDSICPAPMTQLTIREVRDAFGGKITIMGGIPSVALLASSMSSREFDAFLDDFFSQIADGRHLILGISDTTPPAADFERIIKITDRVRDFHVPA